MLGIVVSMIFIIPFSDKYGRRPLLILNAVLGTLAQGGFLLTKDLTSYYILMFIMGLAASLNPCVGYVYLMEIVEK